MFSDGLEGVRIEPIRRRLSIGMVLGVGSTVGQCIVLVCFLRIRIRTDLDIYIYIINKQTADEKDLRVLITQSPRNESRVVPYLVHP